MWKKLFIDDIKSLVHDGTTENLFPLTHVNIVQKDCYLNPTWIVWKGWYEKGELLGLVGLRKKGPDPKCGHSIIFEIRKDRHRQGLGLRCLLKLTKNKNFTLTSLPENHDFYTRAGFLLADTYRTGYGLYKNF